MLPKKELATNPKLFKQTCLGYAAGKSSLTPCNHLSLSFFSLAFFSLLWIIALG